MTHTEPKQDYRAPRWATRAEAMAYMRIGPTTISELIRDRKIVAKRHGTKVIVELNSVDDYHQGLPDAAGTEAA